MQRTLVAMSTAANPEDAFFEVSKKVRDNCISPQLIIFFSNYDNFYFYTNKIHEVFPNSVAIGSTSYMNFCSAGFAHEGFSLMAINDGIECSCETLYELSSYPKRYIKHIYRALDELTSTENTCCLEFCTAYSNGEEFAMDTFKEAFIGKNIPVLGSSAGSGLSDSEKTVVSLNGKCFVNSCVFVLIHNLEGRIAFYQENIFKPTDYVFSVTDVDLDNRRVYEYDGKPAANAFVERLGISRDEIENYLRFHPMGRPLGNKIYITDLNKIMDDGSITYYSQIYNHSKLLMLELDDIKKVWKKTSKEIQQKIQKASFSIVMNCITRTRLFEKENLMEEFNDELNNNYGSFVGISGFGEQMDFINLNQTMVIVMFE